MTSLERKKTFFDFFPAPEFLALSTTGIVITDTDIKFMQLRRKMFSRGFELAHASKANNPPGAVEAGLIHNPDELIPTLKKLSAHYHIRYAKATLAEEKTYLFTTSINWVSSEGLRDAVAFIIEENVPITLSEAVFDFEIVSGNEALGELKLAVSVVPKNVVDTYVGLFGSVSITPISFDLESQAMARAVIRRGDKQPTLIVNLAPAKSGFYVVEDEVVQFSTTLAHSIVGESRSLNVNDLREEMHKVITFWNSRTNKSGQPERRIEKVVICGLGGNKTGFVEALMGGSEVPHSIADVWQNLSPSKGEVPEIPVSESLDYATAIGLLLS